MKVTALAGGVGGAKLLVGLQRALSEAGHTLTAIVNTGDDAEIYDVHVSPDVDICTYWLAGIADTVRGWGIKGDSFRVLEALRSLGVDTWFSLGDRDFATCLFRTGALGAGRKLTVVTDEIRRSLGVPTRLLPMSDDRVRTEIVTHDHRTLDFQTYFVKERTRPKVAEIMFSGIAEASPGPGVLTALEEADRIVICPSNPIVSIGPILGLPGVRNALRSHPRVIGVSPIVRGAALKGPADRMLTSLGSDSSASGVARLYSDFVNLFVVDRTDEQEVGKVEALGVRAAALDTIMTDHDASEKLAHSLLQL